MLIIIAVFATFLALFAYLMIPILSGDYQKTFIIYNSEIKDNIFLENFKNFRYNVSFILSNRYFQSVIRTFFKTPKVSFIQENLVAHDQENILINWIDDSKLDPKANIVIIFPGLTGCCCTSYIRALCHVLKKKSIRIAVHNYRGICKSILKNPILSCPYDFKDMELTINHVKNKYPDAEIAAIGISMGSMMLFNYLSQVQKNTPIKSALLFSTVWNPKKSTEALEQPLEWLIFNRQLTKYLVKAVKKNYHVFNDDFDLPKILRSRTVREFDHNLTIKAHSLESVDFYYEQIRIETKIPLVQIPVMCINAEDDPFVPSNSIPYDEVRNSENVTLLMTKHGGHCGFIEGWPPSNYGLMERAAITFTQTVFTNPSI